MHTQKHLFVDCTVIGTLWKDVSYILDTDITWDCMILGLEKQPESNTVVSLLCYLIYKKYVTDRENINKRHTNVKIYIKNELSYKLKVYEKIISQR